MPPNPPPHDKRVNLSHQRYSPSLAVGLQAGVAPGTWEPPQKRNAAGGLAAIAVGNRDIIGERKGRSRFCVQGLLYQLRVRKRNREGRGVPL
jgi:hypothetical protein